MPDNKPYERLFIIIDKDDMKKLKKGRLVYMDATEISPPVVLCTEEGYKNFQEFWGEENDRMLLHDPITDIIDES